LKNGTGAILVADCAYSIPKRYGYTWAEVSRARPRPFAEGCHHPPSDGLPMRVVIHLKIVLENKTKIAER
jgi:hypothetical protein